MRPTQTIAHDLALYATWRSFGASVEAAAEWARRGMEPIAGAAGDIMMKYGTSNQSITCTIGNNPTGTINQHGRISNAVDNTSDLFVDAAVFLKIKTGGSSPSSNKQVIIYGLGTADGGTTYTDGFAAGDADSAVVPNTANRVGVIPVAASGTTYYGGPWLVSKAFDGILPDHWALYVFNDSGQTLSTTNADFAVFYQGVLTQYTVV